jgi:hypothetical protein
MMAKTPKRIQIKPAMVDVGRGLQPATVPFPSAVGGRRRVLPPEGAEVSLEGADGSYWQRRINEKSVVVVESGKPAVSPKADRTTTKGDEQ